MKFSSNNNNDDDEKTETVIEKAFTHAHTKCILHIFQIERKMLKEE